MNSGRYTGKKDPEKTILKTNLEAAREIARQLRLRDVGGIIVCDFIDMETKSNRDKVLQELRTHLGRDRARTKALEVFLGRGLVLAGALVLPGFVLLSGAGCGFFFRRAAHEAAGQGKTEQRDEGERGEPPCGADQRPGPICGRSSLSSVIHLISLAKRCFADDCPDRGKKAAAGAFIAAIFPITMFPLRSSTRRRNSRTLS